MGTSYITDIVNWNFVAKKTYKKQLKALKSFVCN